ncbi:MAG: hypothetical protein E6J20_04055 [Chloroflexi bacterium]|nr:MAG: hypothetical protein E6J20_04055 [Chloroflexota bacterium]
MPIRVVNIIPQSLSGETNFDSEPSIAVNPSDPRQIVVTSFTPDTASPVTTGPYFFSSDGGSTWSQNSVIPGGNATFGTKDISVRFGGSSGVLYAGILRGDSSLRLNILRKANYSGPGLMAILVDRTPEDQPWVEAATQWNTDRVFVSSNDLTQRPTGATASVDFDLDAANTAAFTNTARLETRASAALPPPTGGSQDGPSVRTAIHRSGVLYAVFFGWRTFASPNVTDIVVCRDDNWANSAPTFRSLTDPGDGNAGFRVATGVSVAALGTLLGTQRIGSNLTIAVDPRNSQRVYVAWCDGLATTASPYTLRIRRSDNGGQNWTPDLFTVSNATNPSLAVNTQGVVALLYQQLATVSGTARWRTHLVRSTDHFATVTTDTILADVIDSSAGAALSVIIGDYANLISIGKDLYGAFSGQNAPLSANFPAGVTYLRNANFVSGTLLAVDNVTPVSTSVDPFFFQYQTVALNDDFYVRDWTDSPTSGDDGSEPSIKPAFYVTSDVWNRRDTLPGSFPHDQPENEDAGNGLGNIGDNWLFARVRRRAPAPAGSPAVTVNAHFLVSKLGTGSNYEDASDADPDVTLSGPDPTLLFAAAEVGPKTTNALAWHLNPIASTHLCVAVEISTPADPFVPPSLHGRAPGWPTTDLDIVDDNNKAQRNMGLSTTPARGTGLCLSDAFAIVHNAATYPRDMLIRYTISPDVIRRVGQLEIEIPGRDRIRVRDSGTITMDRVQPGENRWIGVRLRAVAGKESETLAIFFDEIVNGSPLNGFGLGIRLGSDPSATIYAMQRLLSVFTRLLATWSLTSAPTVMDLASRVLRALARSRGRASRVDWANDLRADARFFAEIRDAIGRQDPFDVERHAKGLRKSLESNRDAESLVCLCSYLERIDAHVTMLQLRNGARADIFQNVRWQQDVLSRLKGELTDSRRRIDELCQEFIQAWDGRRVGARDFPRLVRRLLAPLEKLSGELQDAELKTRLEALVGGGDDPATLQHLHREVLLKLQTHAGR